MDIFSILIFFRLVAVAVGVGGSLTKEFLIIESIKDGHIDSSEHHLGKVVDGLLRAVFSLFFISTICLILLYKVTGQLTSFSGVAPLMELTVLFVIGAVSIATEADLFPYAALSAVSTVSWVCIFFFELYGGSIHSSYAVAIVFYALAVSIGIFIFESLRRFSYLR